MKERVVKDGVKSKKAVKRNTKKSKVNTGKKSPRRTIATPAKRAKKKAVYVYIDNENVNVSIQKQGRKMDRGKLIKWLRAQRDVEMVYMFMGYHPEYEKMYDFFDTLGYTLIFRKMHTEGDGPLKGNIDTELVLQAMIDFDKYSEAIIMSGDGDFTCLVEYLHLKEKLGALIVPNAKRHSSFLAKAAGKENTQSLTGMKRTLKYTPRKTKKTSKKSVDEDQEPFYM